LGAAAYAQPGLRLRHSPVKEIQIGIVAAGDPRIATGAEQIRKRSPGISARLAFARHSLELPEWLAVTRVVGADVTAFLLILRASRKPLHPLSTHHQRPGSVAITPLRIGDRRLPDGLPCSGIERVQLRVGC